MKTMKKALAVLLSALMMLSLCSVAFAAHEHTDFTYIDGSWYAQPGGWWIDNYQLKNDTNNAVYSDWGTMYYMCSCGDALKIVYSNGGETVTEIHVRGEEGQDVYFRNVHVLPEFVGLPTSEAGLETGAYWFDLEGFISFYCSSEEEAEEYRNATWQLGMSENDMSIIRSLVWYEDANYEAGGYYSKHDFYARYEWPWQYLQQAGMHEHDFDYIYTSTDWSEPGEYWYDADGLAQALNDTNYSWASYYLCAGRDAIMIYVYGAGQPTTETHVFADEPLYAQFLKTVPAFGDPLPTSDAGLENGEQWFDLAGFVDLFGGIYDEENQASMLEGNGCLSEDGTILRFTWLYHDEYEGQPISYNRHIDSRAGDSGWDYLHTVGVEPVSDFYELPTDPADAQGPDYYWYDKDGFLTAFAETYLDPEDPSYEERLAVYEGASFYLSSDAQTLRMIIGSFIFDIDVNDPLPEDEFLVAFLRHFIRLPTHIDDLEPGDLWFDAFKYNHYYDNYRYYLSDDGNTLMIVTDNYLGSHWDESVQGYISDYETFIYTRAEDPDMFDYVRTFTAFGDPLPTADSDDFEYGDYWFDLEGLLAFYTDYYNSEIENYNEYYEQLLAEQEQAQAALEAYVEANPNDEEGRLSELQAALDIAAGNAEGWAEELAAMRAELDAILAGIRNGTFRLSEDEYVLRVDYTVTYTYEGETETEDETDFDTPYRGSMYWYYLRQHGVDPFEGFELLALDTDSIPYGGWYLDFEAYFRNQVDQENAAREAEGEDPLTEEEIAANRAEELEQLEELDLYFNPETEELMIANEGVIQQVFTTDIEYYTTYILPFIQGYDPWTGVFFTTDDISAGDYWMDLESFLGEDAPDTAFSEFLVSNRVEVLPNVAAIRVSLAVDDVEEPMVIILAPEGDFAEDYAVWAACIYLTFADSKESTCAESGYENAVAITRDGETVILAEGTPLALAAHTFGEWQNEQPATCTEPGVKAHKTCSVCQKNFDADDVEIEDLAIPAGHTPGEAAKENDVPSTCLALGSYDMVVRCTVCREVLESEHYDYTEYGAHQFGEWIGEQAATCTQDGVKAHKTCAVCEKNFDADDAEIEDLAIPAGHTPGEAAKENDVPSTCKALGSYDMVVRCTVCREVLESEHYDYTEYGAHQFGEWIDEQSATCTAPGVKGHKTCAVCEKNFDADDAELEDLVIPQRDHTPGEAAKENDVPSTCKALGSYDMVVRCTECRNVLESEHIAYTEYADHTPKAPVKENDTPSTCEALGSYDLVTYCSVCGDELGRETVDYTEYADHTPGAPVKENEVSAACTAAGSYEEVVYCAVCGDEISRTAKTVPAAGHIWGEWTVIREATEAEDGYREHTCTVCGVTEGETFPANEPHVCNWCGEIHTGFLGFFISIWHSILYIFARFTGQR